MAAQSYSARFVGVGEGLKSVDLKVGKTVLGRGPELNVSDMSCSRQQIELSFTGVVGEVSVLVLADRPVRQRLSPENSIVLSHKSITTMKDGDEITLLGSRYLFRFDIRPIPVVEESTSLGKRSRPLIADDESDRPAKKMRSDEVAIPTKASNLRRLSSLVYSFDELDVEEDMEEAPRVNSKDAKKLPRASLEESIAFFTDSDSDVEADPAAEDDAEEEATTGHDDEHAVVPKTDDEHMPDAPAPGAVAGADKPPCRHGAACYRKNPAHLSAFWHPPPSASEEDMVTHDFTTTTIPTKPKAKPAAAPPPPATTAPTTNEFTGKVCCLTGALTAGTRKVVSARLLNLGALISTGVSGRTDILIAGDRPGSKMTKGLACGVRIMEDDEFNEALARAEGAVGGGGAPVGRARPAPAVGAVTGARVLPPSVVAGTHPRMAVDVLLAKKFNPKNNPTGWWMSEKLDGVRALWNGRNFVSRLGNIFEAPDYFLEGLPSDMFLDGELWGGRRMFQTAVGIVKSKSKGPGWKSLKYMIFDTPTPGDNSPFEARMSKIEEWFNDNTPPFCAVVQHRKCNGHEHLQSRLKLVEAKGGEGLMLRQPRSQYVEGRSSTLLKVKTFHDAEAKVIGHTKLMGAKAGKGKPKVGALILEMESGNTFNCGTGFSDHQRENPPPIGSIVTYKFQELSRAGIPRFPVFVGERADMIAPKDYVPGGGEDDD